MIWFIIAFVVYLVVAVLLARSEGDSASWSDRIRLGLSWPWLVFIIFVLAIFHLLGFRIH